MKIVKWRLKSGKKLGQEESDTKRKKGLEYIEKLKESGENVVSVEEVGNEFVISIQE